MATRNATPRAPCDTPRWALPGSPDNLDGAEQIAHDIVAERRDLLPSVARIKTADLGTDLTLTALELFRHALTQPGDMHRDPRIAIADASRHQTTAPPPRRKG